MRPLAHTMLASILGALIVPIISQVTVAQWPLKSVRDFGAIGDGVADDTAAIQRAVDSAVGQILFPHGTYRLTSSIVVELDKVGFASFTGLGTARIIMAGAGPAIRFIGTHDGSANPSDFDDRVWLRQNAPAVDSLHIVGAHAEAVGVEARGVMQLTLTRVVVREALHGVHLVERDRNVTIADCHIYNNRGVGVFYDNVDLHQSNLTNCHISYNARGGVVVRGGNVRNVHIGTCDIESNMSRDQPPTANVLIEGAGGSVAEVAITGCTLQHNHDSPDSANIRVIGLSPKRPFTDELRDGNVTIANNVLSDVQTNIELRGARGVVITGNTLWKAFSHQLDIRDSTDVVVGPNVLHDNPRYNYGDGPNARLAVLFENCSDSTITGLHVHGTKGQPAGVVVRRSRRMNLTNLSILDCDGAGLLLDDVHDSRVSDCLIRDDRANEGMPVAIRVVGGRNLQIVDNAVNGQIIE